MRRLVRRAVVTCAVAPMMLFGAMPAHAQESQPQVCTDDVAVDLSYGAYSTELHDWLVSEVRVLTEEAACEDVAVAAYLLDGDDVELAWGTDHFVNGFALIEIDEGLAPVGLVEGVRIELPTSIVDGNGDGSTPSDGPDGSPDSDEAVLILPQVIEGDVPPTTVRTAVSGPLPATGSDLVLLVAAGLAGIIVGMQLRRKRAE